MKRDYLEDLSVDGMIILKYVLNMCDGELWTRLLWLRIGTGGEWRALLSAVMNVRIP